MTTQMEALYVRAVANKLNEITLQELAEALGKAERELFEWATGGRSSTNEMLKAESGFASRTQTLVEIATRDAEEIRAARERVLALRLLIGDPA